MNKIKPTSLRDRVKAAVSAFRGKPIGTLSFGIEVKRCADCRAMSAEEFIDYIEKAFNRPHGDSFWIDERENIYHGVDVGYAGEWWTDCMRLELLRVFGERRVDQ